MQIKYVKPEKNRKSLRLDDLRAAMRRALLTGSLMLDGELDLRGQLALLKFVEERPNVTITTSSRLIPMLESRASAITGTTGKEVLVSLVALAAIDAAAAQAITDLARRFGVSRNAIPLRWR